jgi:hypothetical protein
MKISEKYRAKALDCEQRVRDATDYYIKCAWGEVAIEWHCLSNRTGQESGLDYELEFTPRAPQVPSPPPRWTPGRRPSVTVRPC